MRLRDVAVVAVAVAAMAGAGAGAVSAAAAESGSPADVMRERAQQGLGFYAAEQAVPSHSRLPPSMLEAEAEAEAQQAAAAVARPAPLRFATVAPRAQPAFVPDTGAPSMFREAAGLPPPPGGADYEHAPTPAMEAAARYAGGRRAVADAPVLVEERAQTGAPIPPRARPYPAGLPSGPPPSMPAARSAPPAGSYLPPQRREEAPAVHRMPAPLPDLPSFAVVSETARVHQHRRRHHRHADVAPQLVEERSDTYYGGRGGGVAAQDAEEAPMPSAPRMPHLPAPPVAAPL